MDTSQKYAYTNHLIKESSPYLLQHAHNPVDWYTWGDEAFEKAKREDKLVLVSIGYSACHWCHVMEHESFENEEIARLMNEHFVCIKVDREERPDVDHLYMDAVQQLTGRGGWPLNCFALPDGRPIWGGTYFNPEQWTSVLTQLAEMYKTNRQPLLDQAKQLVNDIKTNNLIEPVTAEAPFSEKELMHTVNGWKYSWDTKWGGNTGAPKFPMPVNLSFLMDYYYFTGDDGVKKHIELTLEKIQAGGIYDQIGGGFARYSTDERWFVPHFEKMLYDNTQLTGLYAQAYRLWHKSTYKTVVYQTVDFLKREMLSDEGTFYSSLDADSEGEEGKYYVWTKHEIDSVLSDKAPLFESAYAVTEKGNWEKGNNILFRDKSDEELAKAFGFSPGQVKQKLEIAAKELLEVREKRIRPHTDTKILTSWNALTISSLTEAHRAFGDTLFLEMALRAARFIRDKRMEKTGKLYRAAKNSATMIPAFMDDYAATARAFVNLYQVTFDEQWLQLARQITRYTIDHFYDSSSGLFGYSDKTMQSVMGNKTEMSDNVIPSSNALMATVLYDLGIYFENREWSKFSGKMMHAAYNKFMQYPGYHAQWGLLLNRFVFPFYEVVFTGTEATRLHVEFTENYLPALVAGSTKPGDLPLIKDRVIPGRSLIYVCEKQTCKLPVPTVKDAINQIRKWN